MTAFTSSDDILHQSNRDLSKLSSEEIHRLKDTIIEQARRKVDPEETGFDARMSFSDFQTDDWAENWWEWLERVSRAISDGATRIGLGVMAGAGVIGAAQLFNSEGGSHYATIVLGVSGLFALWFAASAVGMRFR